MQALLTLTNFINKTLGIWAIVIVLLAFQYPTQIRTLAPFSNYLLGFAMFCIGMNLRFHDFGNLIKHPKTLFIVIISQYIIMPLIAFGLSKAFTLPSNFEIGIILLGCSHSAFSSILMTYLGKGNTTLSVASTAISSLLAPFLIPIIFYILGGQWLNVVVGSMLFTVLKWVLAPIFLGLVVSAMLKKQIRPITKILPLIVAISMLVIFAILSAARKDKLLEFGSLILSLVVLLNCLGYAIGFFTARFFKLSIADSKAIAFQLGMKDAAPGIVLSIYNFKSIATATPSFLFNFWQNFSALYLADIFVNKKYKK